MPPGGHTFKDTFLYFRMVLLWSDQSIDYDLYLINHICTLPISTYITCTWANAEFINLWRRCTCQYMCGFVCTWFHHLFMWISVSLKWRYEFEMFIYLFSKCVLFSLYFVFLSFKIFVNVLISHQSNNSL